MPMASGQTKTCSKCRKQLPVADYNRNRSQVDGYQNQCRTCQHTSSSISAKANPEAKRRSSKNWRESHADYNRERQQKWRKDNQHHVYVYNEQRRQRRLKAPGRGVTPTVWEQIVEAWNGLCVYCFEDVESIDHIIPVDAGGAHDPLNVVPCCKSCNSAKGARMLENWEPGHGLDIARVHEIASQVKRDPRGKFRGAYSKPPAGTYPEVLLT